MSSSPSSSSAPRRRSRPLHNFSLPDLQWSKFSVGDSSSSPKPSPSRPPKPSPRRRAVGRRPPSFNLRPHRLSRVTNSARENSPSSGLSEKETICATLLKSGLYLNKDKKIVASSNVQDGFVTSLSKDKTESKLMTLAISSTGDKIKGKKKFEIESEVDVVKERKLKPIRLRLRNKSNEIKEEKTQSGNEPKGDGFVGKNWNLRPRRPAETLPNSSDNGGKSEVGGGLKAEKKKEEEEEEEEKLKWPQFSIDLTREEVEEDFLAMTGEWPLRKPRTRPRLKAVQRKLDNLLPGSYLGSVTPDSYKVSEPRKKGK